MPDPYHEETLSLHEGEGEVEVADVALLGVAVQHHVRDALRDAPARIDDKLYAGINRSTDSNAAP